MIRAARLFPAFPAVLIIASCLVQDNEAVEVNNLRPSAWPLITIDPYTNCWALGDTLCSTTTKHWTGKDMPLTGILTVDGIPYRFLGAPSHSMPCTGQQEVAEPLQKSASPADGEGPTKWEGLLQGFATSCERCAEQKGANVQAMNTYFSFECGPVALDVTFTATLFLADFELVSRPVNYISTSVQSLDGARHEISLRILASELWSLNTPDQDYECGSGTTPAPRHKGRAGGYPIRHSVPLTWVRAGSKDQNVLGRKGDDVRIDWGWFYLAGSGKGWRADGETMALERDFGRIRSGNAFAMVAYDDVRSIRYFGEDLYPWWNRGGNRTIFDALRAAAADYKSLMNRSRAFDRALYDEAKERGGTRYADLCAVAYRQAVTAHKLVAGPDGEPFWFSKENNSNGSIGTVDVTYPSFPIFRKYSPRLLEAMLNPIFNYSESGRWTKPFPAHDLGTYPIAEGQTYPYDMPVEEAGNMILLTAIIPSAEGYSWRHRETLTRWAEYLLQFGYNPDNQLCTDDFAGRLAHNVNLSAKAICALGAFGQMAAGWAEIAACKDEGDSYRELAAKFTSAAREMAARWVVDASDGDHYRLTFDQEGTWSQKYNLVWDKLLGLDLFPESVIRTELDWYLKVQNRYGLPLDSRRAYTKIDWILWTASMAEDRETFEALVSPVWDFENETIDRVPMGDWVWTDKPEHLKMIARSVVGGFFLPLL